MLSRRMPGCTECRVESLVTVDERGQMVLPKDLRERAGLRAGDKLAVLTCRLDGDVCCISLVPVGALTGMIQGLLGPAMQAVFGAAKSRAGRRARAAG